MDKLLLAITPERPSDCEAERVAAMLEAGVDVVHLRHPGASADELRRILRAIPAEWHGRIRLHDRFELAGEFAVGGLHLNGRNPEPPAGYAGGLSRSCHSLAEVKAASGRYDYVTLSPIFPSLSKPGYGGGAFSEAELESISPADRVVALGGITCERIGALRRYNFIGYAMLGALWGAADAVAIIKSLKNL